MVSFMRFGALTAALMFLALLVGLHLVPKAFERSALGFVQAEVEAGVRERIPNLGNETIATGLGRLGSRFGLQQDSARERAASDLPEIVAAVITRYCGCKENFAEESAERAANIRARLEGRAQALGLAQNRLVDIIQGKYDEINGALRTDITIFLSTNLLAFAAIFGATLIRSERRKLTIYPALLLAVAVVICSYFYIFDTDWFWAILFQKYWGFGYALFIALIFGFLVDIVLNYARITLQIVSNLPAALVPSC